MNKDSKLIFEKYQTSQVLVVNEAWYDNVRDWDWNALAEVGKVLDPTGLSSIPDLIRSVQDWGASEDNMYNPMKMGMIIINAYCCIPNLGLLAGGVGGIGWAALKGAAKKAASNPQAAVTISEKILKFLTQTPVLKTTVSSAIDKVLTGLKKSGKIDKTAKDAIMHVFTTGKLDNVQHAINIQGDMLKAGSKRDIFKAGLKPEKGLTNTVFGDTISVPPFAKGVDVPFAGAVKGAFRTATGASDYMQSKRDQNNNTPSYPTFSKSKWEQANTGQTFPKKVGDTFLNGKTGQVVMVVEQTDKTDTTLKVDQILPTPEKSDTEKAPATATPAPEPTKPMSNADFKRADYAEVAKQENESKPTSAETPTKPVQDYKGVSIVDFLDQIGEPSDFASRKERAQKMGIPNYTGTASQNLLMLNALKSGKTEVPVKQATAASPSYTSNYMGPAKTATPKPTDLLPKSGAKGKEVSTQFVRVGPGNYRPAVQADLTSKQQLFVRNPNPAARLVYPFIKAENAPVRRANL